MLGEYVSRQKVKVTHVKAVRKFVRIIEMLN